MAVGSVKAVVLSYFYSLFLYTESKSDKGNLYNFSKLKKSRRWLKVRDEAESFFFFFFFFFFFLGLDLRHMEVPRLGEELEL